MDGVIQIVGLGIYNQGGNIIIKVVLLEKVQEAQRLPTMRFSSCLKTN